MKIICFIVWKTRIQICVKPNISAVWFVSCGRRTAVYSMFVLQLTKISTVVNAIAVDDFTMHDTIADDDFTMHDTIADDDFTMHDTIADDDFTMHDNIADDDFTMHNAWASARHNHCKMHSRYLVVTCRNELTNFHIFRSRNIFNIAVCYTAIFWEYMWTLLPEAGIWDRDK